MLLIYWLLCSKAGRKDISKLVKSCCVGIHWIALAEYSHMSTHVPVFQSFFRVFLHQFILAKLATSSLRVHLQIVMHGFENGKMVHLGLSEMQKYFGPSQNGSFKRFWEA